MTNPTRVLDAYAVMTFFGGEAGAEFVRNLFIQALQSKLQLAITVVNLGEVYYSISRTNSMDVADRIVQEFLSLPVEVVPVNWELARLAAQLKAITPIAFADCFAAALAKLRGCPLVTGDPEFHRLESQVSLEWL